MDLTRSLAHSGPVLIISGDWMSPTLVCHGTQPSARDPAARVVHLATAHLSNLSAASFTVALLNFFSRGHAFTTPHGGAPAGTRGCARAKHAAAPDQRGLPELIKRAYGERFWTRPGLDIRARRLWCSYAITAGWGDGGIPAARAHGLEREMEWCDIEEV